METQVSQNESPAPTAIRLPRRVPRVDIYESDTNFLVVADLPGVSPGALRVDLEREELRLQADVPERGFSWSRRFRVPRGIESEHIRAELAGGVLRLTLAKPAAWRPRSVEVKSV